MRRENVPSTPEQLVARARQRFRNEGFTESELLAYWKLPAAKEKRLMLKLLRRAKLASLLETAIAPTADGGVRVEFRIPSEGATAEADPAEAAPAGEELAKSAPPSRVARAPSAVRL
jgi:hypothetical protein